VTTATRGYVRRRAGLGDVLDGLRARARTVAYQGASVTVQREGYRPRLHERLVAATGHEHRAVMAGTGAMGSIAGVVLMDRLVLPHRPDLCFVEYTTSDVDGRTPLEHLGAVLEGIVGKLRGAGCEPCFLHLFRSDGAVAPGQPVYDVYERVAEHHGVPSIDVAAELGRITDAGERSADELVYEESHTTALGSELTASAIFDALRLLGSTTRPREQAPLFDESFRRTEVIPAAREHVADPAAARAHTFRLAYPCIEVDASNELRCRLAGDLLGLLVVVGPDSGWIEVEAGGTVREYELWDEYCFYDRLGAAILTPFCPAGTEVRIRLSERDVDVSRCVRPLDPAAVGPRRLKVVGFMVRE
jgi:hypothetical protein